MAARQDTTEHRSGYIQPTGTAQRIHFCGMKVEVSTLVEVGDVLEVYLKELKRKS